MKLPRSPRGGRLIPGLLACCGLQSLTSAELEIPRGTLAVDQSLVRVGVHSQLDWQIQYPEKGLEGLIDLTDTGTIIPKKKLVMRTRVLGVAYQSGRTLLQVECHWSKNNSSWARIFRGNSSAVNPASVLLETTVLPNDRVDFAGRGASGGSSWNPLHHTRTSDSYVTVLKNGDVPPDYVPAYDQGSVESFLAPYLDGMGRIRIGPRDLIVLWELSTAKPGTTYFDMQDLVALVTFEETP